jgi:hypothetical protein
MKPAHPREILRRATRNPELFLDQIVTIRLGNGSQYHGKWQACDGENFQVILREQGNGSVVWLDAHAIESVSFTHASFEMLSVLSGLTFDPYANADKLGDLAISRQLTVSNESLNKTIGKKIQLTTNLKNTDSPVAAHVLIDLCRALEKTFQNLCIDDFSKKEITNALMEIKMIPSTQAKVEMMNGILSIEFCWEKPDQRWRESVLTEEINKKL